MSRQCQATPLRLCNAQEFQVEWAGGGWDRPAAESTPQADPAGDDPTAVSDAVARIIADVRDRGQAALTDWTQQLDRVDLARFELTRAELRRLADGVSPQLRDALAYAADRISGFASRAAAQLIPRLTGCDLAAAGDVAEMWCPLDKVGIYVPGGRAPYASSVLMTALPARAAGVSQVIMCTPPGPAGSIAPELACAALLAGVDRVFRLGGAQAIAAMALGSGEVPRVDKIAGPGNAYVTEAKRQLCGEVGIDGLAGPSEVVAVGGRPGCEAALADQLLAQAEHDPMARSIGLLLPGTDPDEVLCLLAQGLAELPANRGATAAASLHRHGLLVTVADTAEAAELIRQISPEHLWIDLGCHEQNTSLIGSAGRWAGAVFVGPNSPVALGDYVAGPSHVLPTGGSARWGSPLGAVDFMRRVSVVRLDQSAAEPLRLAGIQIAEAEGFAAHARSMRNREVQDK